jgi:3-oxo-5-alpha-steroid 4-dehydrogenase 1
MPLFSLSWTSYQYVMYGWIGLAILIFFLLLRVTAPYGRHASASWGPQVPNRIGWLLMELPVLIVLWYVLLAEINKVALVSWVMIGLFCFHYVYRSLLFPFRLHTKGKKMPWVVAGSGILFNVMNGFSLGYYFTRFAHYTNDWFSDPRFITGVLLFFGGMYINWKTDGMLIRLRQPNETGYKIPSGWLFEKISCPNLFGELIEWLGFAILCWNLPALTFFIWTAANLIPRALSHHKWYRQKFPDYPAQRKAIFPFYV